MAGRESQVWFAREALGRLWSLGVREVCVCAGSRNAPFVELLSTVNDLRVWWGFEERSAAFFALGRARALGSSVCVITTSGTAVAELLPGVIEAFYSAVPLVVVSCDRPVSFRGTGSPQTIEHEGIFSHFAATVSLDARASSSEILTRLVIPPAAPIHWNIHFDEPLLDDADLIGKSWRAEQVACDGGTLLCESAESSPHVVSSAIANFFELSKQPLCIVGPLTPHEAQRARPLLERLQIPIWAEATSQLREDPTLASLMLPWGEYLARAQAWDGIVRVGGVPTARAWRDLEKNNVPVVSIATPPYWAGTSRPHEVVRLDMINEHSLDDLTSNQASVSTALSSPLNALFAKLFEAFPHAEPSLIRALSRRVPSGARLYLGNSLPIRVWDWAAVREKRWTYGCNRGANGIDGQLSTFLGWSTPAQENWAIVGDLTALYDLAALWYSRSLENTTLRVVIINNSGGKIFSHLYQNPAFMNEHTVRFEAMAALWGWGYSAWNGEGALQDLTRHHLIEVRVDADETAGFYEELTAALGARP